MTDFEAAKLAAHRQNLARYRRLLTSPLTTEERSFIQRRIKEEESELTALQARGRGLLGSLGDSAREALSGTLVARTI